MSQHTALNEQQQNKLVNKVSAIRFNLGIGNFDEAKQRAFSAEQSLIEEGMSPFGITALPAAIRYTLKAESYDRREVRRKLYCIIAGSAV
ncbi:MAG: hypothetical protein V7K50_02070 [Nostoc sp.]|uniref:hypothetical protein n=1 Tax=Nostoc sp. TaxID=1180 RepID=UPI002FF84776